MAFWQSKQLRDYPADPKTLTQEFKFIGYMSCLFFFFSLIALLIVCSKGLTEWPLLLSIIPFAAASVALTHCRAALSFSDGVIHYTWLTKKRFSCEKVTKCKYTYSTTENEGKVAFWWIFTGPAYNPFNVYLFVGDPKLELHKHLPLDNDNQNHP